MTSPAKKNDVSNLGKVVPFAPMSEQMETREKLIWLDWLALVLALSGVAISLLGAYVSATG